MNGTHNAREGWIAAVCSRIRLICAVGTPSRSMKWPSAPTAHVHAGQTGTSRTASTPSSFIRPASSRAFGSNACIGEAPMNE